MKVVVEIVAGARAGQRLELDDLPVIRFGRHPSNEVAFDKDRDRDASSRHAELRVEGGALYLYDLGSANGTRIGGRIAPPRTLVEPGAEIELGEGGPRCRILYAGAGGATVPPTLFNPAQPKPKTGSGGPGSRTVALMIDQALARVRGTSRRMQWVAIGLGAALLVTLAGVIVVWRFRPPPDVALRRAMVKIMDEQRSADEGERAALQKRLDALGGRLKAASGSSGAEIARQNHDAIFLVTVKTPVDEQGFCTAFAIAPDRLITNAHCVADAEDYRRRGGAIWVVQNGHPEVRFPVAAMKRISGFAPKGGGITPDVGWLRPGGERKLPKVVTLAEPAEYQALATGDQMYTYGFPGRLADVSAPEATFVEGVIGRITTLDGRAADVKDERLIQHSAFTSGGTSGSPIFDGAGHVVAVNTGGYAEASPDGKTVVSRSLAGYNFGMRVDLISELLAEGAE